MWGRERCLDGDLHSPSVSEAITGAMLLHLLALVPLLTVNAKSLLADDEKVIFL